MCIDKQRNFHQKKDSNRQKYRVVHVTLSQRMNKSKNMRRKKSHKRKRRIDES